MGEIVYVITVSTIVIYTRAKLWVIWINSDFEFKYIRLIIRYWFCSTIHYLGDEIYSGARLQVLATGWVSPTVL